MQTFQIDGRIFKATNRACESSENWRRAFPSVYGGLPATIAKSFAKRDFNRKTLVSTHG